MKNMERSVNSGLVALAVSDMCFCLAYFTLHFKDAFSTLDSLLELYLRIIQMPLINLFFLTR